jgi:hypothetical protein
MVTPWELAIDLVCVHERADAVGEGGGEVYERFRVEGYLHLNKIQVNKKNPLLNEG